MGTSMSAAVTTTLQQASLACVAGSLRTNGIRNGAANTFRIGTLTYTVRSLDFGATQISFRSRRIFGALWTEDGIVDAGSYLAGGPVIVMAGGHFGDDSRCASPGAVRDVLAKPSGDLTVVDMQSLTNLSAGHAEIHSLAGLEYATNWLSLLLAGNSIGDISPLVGPDQPRRA